MSAPEPKRVLGPYELVRDIATGGMGTVYEARHRLTGEARALKVIRLDLAEDPQFAQRFIREVQLAVAVAHPNLVRVYEPGIEASTMFLPMELLEGETLAERIRRRLFTTGEMLEVLEPICQAVHALHEGGVIHRDLKPANIFLSATPHGLVPKVLDLGAAREMRGSEHTRTGLVVGSPHYMAPEQASGRRDLDGRVDQYAVGVMAYQMLTGRRPYEDDSTGNVVSKLLRADPYPKPREIAPFLEVAMEETVLRAMAQDRDDRFPSMLQFANALRAACSDGNTQILPVEPDQATVDVPEFTPPPPVQRFGFPRGRALAAASAVCILVAVGVWLSGALDRPAPDATTHAEAHAGGAQTTTSVSRPSAPEPNATEPEPAGQPGTPEAPRAESSDDPAASTAEEADPPARAPAKASVRPAVRRRAGARRAGAAPRGETARNATPPQPAGNLPCGGDTGRPCLDL